MGAAVVTPTPPPAPPSGEAPAARPVMARDVLVEAVRDVVREAEAGQYEVGEYVARLLAALSERAGGSFAVTEDGRLMRASPSHTWTNDPVPPGCSYALLRPVTEEPHDG